jgi:NAD(P)-dependent dehydrogenase (short-subunit alcohol dehydrogenase family)
MDQLKKSVPDADLHYLKLDLASFASIQEAAKSFLENETKLDILVNNAGVMAMPYQKTADGFEIQFGTCHMGHFLLTQLLLPALLKSECARVVNLSSIGHNAAFRGLPFDKLDTPLSSTWERYGTAKLANLLHAKELNRRYPSITAVSCHPGVIFSNLYDAYWKSGAMKLMMDVTRKMWPVTTELGSLNQLYCATQEVEPGAYYIPVGVVGRPWHAPGPSRFARDPKLAVKLWDYSLEQLEKRGINVDKGVVAEDK